MERWWSTCGDCSRQEAGRREEVRAGNKGGLETPGLVVWTAVAWPVGSGGGSEDQEDQGAVSDRTRTLALPQVDPEAHGKMGRWEDGKQASERSSPQTRGRPEGQEGQPGSGQ